MDIDKKLEMERSLMMGICFICIPILYDATLFNIPGKSILVVMGVIGLTKSTIMRYRGK